MKLKRALIFILFLWLPFASVIPQETEDIKPILAEIQQAGGLKEHPDANALIIFEDTNVVFQESGEFTATEHSLIKILTDKGKQMYATKKLPYHRRYSTIDVRLARVIKPDGRVVPVPKEAMKDGTMEETQQMNILEENFRRISIAFPGVELGDSIETRVEAQSKPLIKGHYNDLIVFQYLEPVLRKRYMIEGPASLPLNYVVKNGSLEFSKTEKENRVFYEWKARTLLRSSRNLAWFPSPT